MTPSTIVGVGAVPCGRYPEKTLADMSVRAVDAALSDAGLQAADVDAIVVGNALAGLMEGQECIRGQVILRGTPLEGKPIINVENACASGSSALHVASMGVASGQYQTILVVGVEKMTHQDRRRAFAALEGALDRGRQSQPTSAERSVFMELYAARAIAHQARAGWTAEDVAAIVVKSRRHASTNPLAQYRDALNVSEVLDARMIAEPLTLPMCSPIGDSAAAIVVQEPSIARRDARSVAILACELRSHLPDGGSVVSAAAEAAYERSGIGPRDIDLAEVHDAVASAELEEYEHLGFAREGEGHLLLRAGETALGGRLPVNTSGGLISRGHPVGATGALQVVELVHQLRGEAGDRQVDPQPIHGLAQNAGGLFDNGPAVAVVSILRAGAG